MDDIYFTFHFPWTGRDYFILTKGGIKNVLFLSLLRLTNEKSHAVHKSIKFGLKIDGTGLEVTKAAHLV